MTAKHYRLIAKSIRFRFEAENRKITGFSAQALDTVRCIAIDLADDFQQDNPKFNRIRFLAACGVEDRK